MDRVQTLVGQEIYEWLWGKQAQNTMVALGKLAAAIYGTTGAVNGLACSPTIVPSMQVSIGQGEIYQMAYLEASTCGTLPADTANQVLKQGILLGSQAPVNLPASAAFTAPATAGQSIAYLIEAQYQDVDVSIDPTTGASPVVLNFYNSANPSVPWAGPNNSGAASNTFRKGTVAFQVKAGAAATTGTQVTPSTDTGWIGLYVVTVAYGQTTISSSNIATVSGAPFITPGAGLGSGGSGSYMPLSGGTFTGAAYGPTAAQFNSSQLLATTAFVMRALGAYSGVQQYNTSQALVTANDANKVIFCGGSGTYTLPPFSTVAQGTVFLLVSQGGTNSLVPNGSDTLAVGSTSLSSVTFSLADTVEITAGTSGWRLTGGSAMLPYTAAFLAARGNHVSQPSVSFGAGGSNSANSFTFVAPCRGRILAIATLSKQPDYVNLLAQLFINGTLYGYATTGGPIVNLGSASVSAGQTCTITQTVSAPGAGTSYPADLELAYVFVPGQ